jgi:AcrR family transcriptional regulator
MSSRPAVAGGARRPGARDGAHVIEMQRRRLLLAMQELAGEVGLADATVGAVCRRSRVSRRTFYELFADRDACFLAAFEFALSDVGGRVLPVFEQQGRWRDRVRAGLGRVLDVFDDHPSLARLCVVETLKGGPAVLARRRGLLELLAAVVDEGRGEARAGSPPPLTAESTVGGVLAVVHARLLDPDAGPLVELAPSLMSMVVFPYLGSATAQRELQLPGPVHKTRSRGASDRNGTAPVGGDPFRGLSIRFTYRTARVLAVIADAPGASNRQVGDAAGAPDQGQMSKLLKRLLHAGLIENHGPGGESGEPNAWRLTPRGQAIHTALGTNNS